jgi:hypothetical protein
MQICSAVILEGLSAQRLDLFMSYKARVLIPGLVIPATYTILTQAPLALSMKRTQYYLWPRDVIKVRRQHK